MARNDVTIKVGADTRDADKKLGAVSAKAKNLGNALGGALRKGALAGGVAVAALGVASVKMGLDFDGDTICINCGFVLYARAPDPTPPNRAIACSESRFYRRRVR